MFSSVLKEVTGALDRRFLLTLFLPSLLFWGALLAVFSPREGSDALLAGWSTPSTELQWLQIAAAVAWVTFFAYVLSSQTTWLTRQFEGYWSWPLGDRLCRWRKRHYAKVLSQLEAAGDEGYERIYYAYPLPDGANELMPTRLGNILKNAELYSYERYKIDAVLLWPRLYAVLPDSFVATLGEAKASLEMMLVLSFLGGLFALTAGVGLLILRGPWWLFLGSVLGGLGLAYVAYRSALGAAIPYAQLIKSAFDLYRGDLLDKLGYKRLETQEDEIAFWGNLNKLIYRGTVEEPSALPYRGAREDLGEPEPSDFWLSILGRLIELWTGRKRSS